MSEAKIAHAGMAGASEVSGDMLARLLARSRQIVLVPGTVSVSHLDDSSAAAAIELTLAEVACLNREVS